MSNSIKTRTITRFAPSPTGYLHLGGARTALFNWILAMKFNGKFLLRIEDTDKSRLNKKALSAIFEGLKWLGINWDDDVIYQSNRNKEYRAVVEKLLKEGKAYRCYSTTEEIDATYLASMTLLVATFLVFPFTFLESGLHFSHQNEVLLSVFLLGFLCTGLAYMGYVILIKRVGPVKASTVVLIVPVSGMLWANLFLDEAITYTMLVGCLLIITGVGLINFFKDDLN